MMKKDVKLKIEETAKKLSEDELKILSEKWQEKHNIPMAQIYSKQLNLITERRCI